MFSPAIFTVVGNKIVLGWHRPRYPTVAFAEKNIHLVLRRLERELGCRAGVTYSFEPENDKVVLVNAIFYISPE